MLDAEEREGSSRGRLDILLEQLGPNVVSETLEVELGALGGFQSGVEPLEGGVLERLNALGLQMGMTVKWWDEELPLSDVGGVDLEEPPVALEEELPLSDVGGVDLEEPPVALEDELPAAGVSTRSRGALVEIFSFAGAVLPLFPLLFPLVPPQDVPEGEAGHGEPSSPQAIRRARPWSRPGLTYIPALPPVYDVVAGTSPQTRSRRVSSRCEADNI